MSSLCSYDRILWWKITLWVLYPSRQGSHSLRLLCHLLRLNALSSSLTEYLTNAWLVRGCEFTSVGRVGRWVWHVVMSSAPLPASAPVYEGEPVFELSLGKTTSFPPAIQERASPSPILPPSLTLPPCFSLSPSSPACSSLVGSLRDCVPSALIVTSIMTPPQAYWIRYAQTEVIEVSTIYIHTWASLSKPSYLMRGTRMRLRLMRAIAFSWSHSCTLPL